ncbi:MAG: hypothetical protein DLM69_08175 [Candidatus Chloroheliales bacterium]|nr:MAG: hypothetical protein DLM69_08175 [Chloroflexota bacterium]
MSEPSNPDAPNPAVNDAASPAAEASVPERTLSDERYRHMGSERESHLQAIRGVKRRSLIYDDDFPGSWWESVTNERYGPEEPTPTAAK